MYVRYDLMTLWESLYLYHSFIWNLWQLSSHLWNWAVVWTSITYTNQNYCCVTARRLTLRYIFYIAYFPSRLITCRDISTLAAIGYWFHFIFYWWKWTIGMTFGRNDVLFRPMVNDEQEIDGLVRDCGGSSALTLELLQSCTGPSKRCSFWLVVDDKNSKYYGMIYELFINQAFDKPIAMITFILLQCLLRHNYFHFTNFATPLLIGTYCTRLDFDFVMTNNDT